MPDSWDYAHKRPERPSPPVMTYGLVVLCVVITLANWYPGQDRSNVWYALGHIVSVNPQTIWSGHYAPLLTSMFLHGSIVHIAFNMIWLVRLGSVLEETVPPLAYATFVVTSAVIGSGAELAWSSEVGIGMSGVVYAMAGLMWAGRSKVPAWRPVMTRYVLNTFLIWGVFCIIATWTDALRVANAAHFGGLLYGFAVGFLFYSQRQRPLWSVVLGALVATTIASVTWMPWSPAWTYWKGDRAAAQRDYPTAIAWYEKSVRNDAMGLVALSRISTCWQLIRQDAATRKDAAAEQRAAREEKAAFDRMIAMESGLHAAPVEDAEGGGQSPLDAMMKAGSRSRK